ncbi:MAG: hypothetical protein WCC11_10355 [Gammaproteobacteria bacterium]
MLSHRVNRFAVACLFGVGFIALNFGAYAADISPGTVIANADEYDGQRVQVKGAIKDFKDKISHRGNEYETFELCESDECINVFAWGETPYANGNVVSLSGTFFRVKRVGRYIFYNELDVGSD